MRTQLLVKTAMVAAAAATMLGTQGVGQADPERRTNGLESQPAVRHRILLVKNRLELTPLFESTVNAEFRHIIGGGAKLEYHLSDMFSIGVVGAFSTAIDTGLVTKINATLSNNTPKDPREPTLDQFNDHLNSQPIHGAAYIGITPWYGKLAAFGSAFVNFDFYFQAGVSFAQLNSNCPTSVCSDTHPGTSIPDPAHPGMNIGPDDNPNNDPALNSGTKIGLYVGGGIHVFLNDFMALDLTVRDYAFSDNPSGADFNADLFVSEADNRFLNHLFVGAGLSFMFPSQAKRTP
jgi:outer membrane beta-barrel protein